ncbi:CYFA0S22e02190g1_1 [Cyberlindnera fabianii]|uniref:CYFA0S22e02190g1_1 n=1 Tax=Cyberlindnera fabianii TaxID=36022 RepID=A0A061BH18_CYBFA|nr:Nuclear and cytoplasmic polyadenylated RNA-binding protein PUB1 [Cyberlindnera fabianii]CDR46291.1 CYFA0S22e02190g1_1 [Cyberlindnera fabianii]
MSTEEVVQVPQQETTEQPAVTTSEQVQTPTQAEEQVESTSTETPDATPSTESTTQQQDAQKPEVPEITPALASEGGREVSRKILYVGGLTKTVTEENLREIFGASGAVESVKILFDKNRAGFNYAFVEFEESESASNAFESLNGKVINGSTLTINWAYQSQQAKSNPDAFNVFVGDLSAEINDEKLKETFAKFPSLLQAHVMWDMQSGRSRGYGFVSFEDQKDADEAISTMNGEVISGRAIRLNWASHKAQTHGHGQHHGHHGHHHSHHHHNNGNLNLSHNGHYYKYNNHHHNGNYNGNYQQNQIMNNGTNGSPVAPGTPLGANGVPLNGTPLNGNAMPLMSPPNYETVLRKSPSWQTTVYLGNLAHFTTQNDIIPLLQNFGFIVDIKFYPERGCAFVKYDSHERAAVAIVQLAGLIVNGRPLKLGWGRERSPNTVPYQNYGPMYGQ